MHIAGMWYGLKYYFFLGVSTVLEFASSEAEVPLN